MPAQVHMAPKRKMPDRRGSAGQGADKWITTRLREATPQTVRTPIWLVSR